MNAKHVDIVIVGAGLSGIGMACHLSDKCPKKDYAILEGRMSMGGTWDLFRYPGVRSDSDMHTLSYKFKPWQGEKDIADGAEILDYLKETAAQYGVERLIRYGHQVTNAAWSTEDAKWTLDVTVQRANAEVNGDGESLADRSGVDRRGVDKSGIDEQQTSETIQITCNMLLMCSGYYSYKRGHTPKFDGLERFKGRVIHPQTWPQDLGYRDQRVIVIGSGATAVTLVPALAKQAKHVVMLQRSPTYMLVRSDVSQFARLLRKTLPARAAHAVTRWWNIWLSSLMYRRTRARPERIKKLLLFGIRRQLGRSFDIKKHFTPTYNPWDQRLCVVPNGDLFKAIKAGQASMVTEQIDHFVEKGIQLQSGQQLEADIIVTATGLKMESFGGMQVVVDGQDVDFSQTFTYKGMMTSDVPNLVSTFGYINASWTLRSDLIADFTCRLIQHLDRQQMRQCTPRVRKEDRDMVPRPFIEDFSSNYIQRTVHLLPKQGDREPWVNSQSYQRELKLIGRAKLEDGSMIFSNPAVKPTEPTTRQSPSATAPVSSAERVSDA